MARVEYSERNDRWWSERRQSEDRMFRAGLAALAVGVLSALLALFATDGMRYFTVNTRFALLDAGLVAGAGLWLWVRHNIAGAIFLVGRSALLVPLTVVRFGPDLVWLLGCAVAALYVDGLRGAIRYCQLERVPVKTLSGPQSVAIPSSAGDGA